MMCNGNSTHIEYDGSGHIINDLALFTDFKPLAEPIRITVAKMGEVVEATHIVSVSIKVNTTLGYSGELMDVLYSRSVPANLISVRRIQEARMSVIFTETGLVEIKKGNTTMITGHQEADLLTKSLESPQFKELREKIGLQEN
ncbi:unnamed protein product [Ceutorhynchus assimilis]|uniref:Retrovirus-related Pol polyprotein from transposon TNT 1-94-like beta-barrel domain-containing protein n=1 Tax=Ceutorhynchus assimilis TaxID=467358 RepID=A0A9N9MEY3_9CUCU|nr:unnamed protein product [Ceutorhynchus assimilis]